MDPERLANASRSGSGGWPPERPSTVYTTRARFWFSDGHYVSSCDEFVLMGRSQAISELLLSAGLCGDCRHAGLKSSARSVFLLCRLSDLDSRFPRYPRLPVLECSGHRRRELPEAPRPEDASSPRGC